MNVTNIHERKLKASAAAVGALIDSLSSSDDQLWPNYSWPPLKFDRPLSVGANGGHGPVRYFVEAYRPGRSIRFRFVAPRGFDGTHRYEVQSVGQGEVTLRHTLEMRADGPALLTWPLLFRPLHDALIEDSLTRAEASLGLPARARAWPLSVKLLRLVFCGGKAGRQVKPKTRVQPG